MTKNITVDKHVDICIKFFTEHNEDENKMVIFVKSVESHNNIMTKGLGRKYTPNLQVK